MLKTERQHGAEPGLLEQRPERPRLEPFKLARPVVDRKIWMSSGVPVKTSTR